MTQSSKKEIARADVEIELPNQSLEIERQGSLKMVQKTAHEEIKSVQESLTLESLFYVPALSIIFLNRAYAAILLIQFLPSLVQYLAIRRKIFNENQNFRKQINKIFNTKAADPFRRDDSSHIENLTDSEFFKANLFEAIEKIMGQVKRGRRLILSGTVGGILININTLNSVEAVLLLFGPIFFKYINWPQSEKWLASLSSARESTTKILLDSSSKALSSPKK